MRKATNAFPFHILPEQAAARLKSKNSGTPSCHSAFATFFRHRAGIIGEQ